MNQFSGGGTQGQGSPWGKGFPWGIEHPWGKGHRWGKGFPWGKGSPWGQGGFWMPTQGGGFAKQYPPGQVGIPYGYYPGYGKVQ